MEEQGTKKPGHWNDNPRKALDREPGASEEQTRPEQEDQEGLRRRGPGPSCFSESAPSPLGFFEGHEESIKEPDLSSSSQNAMESWKTKSGRHTPTERQVASFHGVSISMCSNPEAPQEKVGAPTP